MSEQAKRRLIEHFGLDESLACLLVGAGLITPRQIKAASDKALRSIASIGDAAVGRIRDCIDRG